jgi:hypothetical protein
MNLKGSKAIKGFEQPKRSRSNGHIAEGAKSYSYNQKKTEASLTSVGTRMCMYYNKQTKFRDALVNAATYHNNHN